MVKGFLLAPGQSFNVQVNPWLMESGRCRIGGDMGCYGMKTNVFEVSPEFIGLLKCCCLPQMRLWLD